MAEYAWRGPAFNSPILTLSKNNNISILSDVQYNFSNEKYDFKLLGVRIEKLDEEEKETGKFIFIPTDFVKELLDIDSKDLELFLEQIHQEEKANESSDVWEYNYQDRA